MKKRKWIVVLEVTEFIRPGLDEFSTKKQMKQNIAAKFPGFFLKAKIVGLKKESK